MSIKSVRECLNWETRIPGTGEVVNIRQVTHQDYQGVLDIADIYEGWDYIRDMYHRIIHDTNSVCLVCEIKGKMVGASY